MSTSAGVDVGSESIKGVVLSRVKDGPVEVLAAGTLPIGELGHMPESSDKTLALGIKLKSLVKNARIRAQSRRVAVSGSATSIRYIQVPPVPPWRLDMLVKYEVDERNAEKEASTYDYHILDVPEVSGQYTVMIGVCRESTALDMLSMGKAAGLGEVEIELEALALYNAYYHGHGFDHDKSVIVVDIGADDLTILICRNGSLWMARTIMGGGRRFTQVLADELKVEPQEADELKKSKAEILFDVVSPSATRTGRLPRPGGGVTGIVGRPPLPGASGVARGVPGGESTLPGLSSPRMNISSTLIDTKPADTVKYDSLVIKEALAAAEKQKPYEPIQAEKMQPAVPVSPPQAPINPPAAQANPLLSDLSVSDIMDLAPALENIDAAPALSPSPAIQAPVAPNIPAPDMSDEKRRRQMSMALVREAAGLCAALENAVLFCKQQSKLRDLKIDRVYVTGGGSKLKGLVEFMSRRMRLEVQPLEPFKQLSLNRLPPAQAADLKAEQHSMAVAVGLAVSDLKKGAFAFLLWPDSLTERKVFWSRGAYLYYAVGLIALSFGLFLYTPFRNSELLTDNKERAAKAVAVAKTQSRELEQLKTDNEEKRQRLKQIEDSTMSGQKFLDILAELKNTRRIGDDIYITQVSTNMPAIVLKAGGVRVEPEQTPADLKKAMDQNKNLEPNTFQYQRKVYVRGFARSNQKADLIDRVEAFKMKLVPHPEDPDHSDNWLFKDIRTLWLMRDDQPQPPYFLKEFVLEAYTESSKDSKTTVKTDKVKPPLAALPAPAPVANGGQAPVMVNPNAGQPVVVPVPAPVQNSVPPVAVPAGKIMLPDHPIPNGVQPVPVIPAPPVNAQPVPPVPVPVPVPNAVPVPPAEPIRKKYTLPTVTPIQPPAAVQPAPVLAPGAAPVPAPAAPAPGANK